MKTLRLLLGDQLNHQHSWYDDPHEDICYFIAEMRQETDYVKHHIQKVVAFFEAMQNFAVYLNKRGHEVIYYKLDDKNNHQDLEKNLAHLIQKYAIKKFEYQSPDEYRLDEQLKNFCNKLAIKSEVFDSEHFITRRNDLSKFYEGKKEMTMEYFYREMRKKEGILMIKGNPEGGQWNFDESNRKKWDGKPKIPQERCFNKDVTQTVRRITASGVNTFGNIEPKRFNWPTSREDGLEVLNYFCKNLLIHFGDFQDAMDPHESYLYHSRLSFALNSKMLHPREVITSVIAYWRDHKKDIDISQVEGFVRQILGWREYMRGVYWQEMPAYALTNKLNNNNELPGFYWTAKTKMNCLHHAIRQSLDHAYAHHIQRLMILGNYALLTQTHPDQVDAWYLGIYIDALQWVEITNTRGMSQFADGGLVATKPYVSSGSYINKMSTYCIDCTYNVSKKTGSDACPFNSLYWNFLDTKKDFFVNNQRMKLMIALLEKKDKNELEALKKRAAHIIAHPDQY